MIVVEVPGRGPYRLAHLVLDVNGTLAVDGQLIAGVAERLSDLRQSLEVHTLTADTHGKQQAIDAQLGFQAVRVAQESVCAIGNGANDAGMLCEAKLGIAILGEEGLAGETLTAAHVVSPHINAALDMLRNPLRLVATLRR